MNVVEQAVFDLGGTVIRLEKWPEDRVLMTFVHG